MQCNDLAATCRTTIGNKISGCVVEFHPKKGVTGERVQGDLHVPTLRKLQSVPGSQAPALPHARIFKLTHRFPRDAEGAPGRRPILRIQMLETGNLPTQSRFHELKPKTRRSPFDSQSGDLG